jgi:hypothetical protein
LLIRAAREPVRFLEAVNDHSHQAAARTTYTIVLLEKNTPFGKAAMVHLEERRLEIGTPF